MLRILLAEDDRVLRELIAGRLRSDGHAVIECATGVDLLHYLDAGAAVGAGGAFDAVISDVCMPGLTGIEVLEGMRHVASAIPVILMTAFGSDELHEQAEELGALRLLDKPFDLDELARLAGQLRVAAAR